MKLPTARPTTDSTNRMFSGIVIGGGGAIGSAISFLVFGAMIYAALAIIFGRLRLSAPREAWWVAGALAFFFAAEALSGIVNLQVPRSLIEIVENLPFLGFLLLYASLARTPRGQVAAAIQPGVVFGAFAAAALAVIQVGIVGLPRAHGMAGNPGPFATVCTLLFCLCLLTAVRGQARWRALAALAALAAAGAMLLSAMRGMWPVLLAAPVLLLLIYGIPRGSMPRLRTIATAGALLLVLGFLSFDVVKGRVGDVIHDYQRITEHGDYHNSIGHRLRIWEAGVALVRERPLLGQGLGGIPELMSAQTAEEGDLSVGYSHFHNFVLDTAVRSGMLGVSGLLLMFAVPFWLAVRRTRDETGDFGFAMLLMLQLTYLFAGLTNIMLHHDILDALFVFGLVTACYLVFGPEREPRGPV